MGRGDDDTEAGRKPGSILEVEGYGAILASPGTSEFGPGCCAAAVIPFLPSEAGAVGGIMAWACDGSIDTFFKAGIALSSIGDSVTLGKATVCPELSPDTSKDVRDCSGPSLCKPEELCWGSGVLVVELDGKPVVRGGIGKCVGGSGKDPRDAIERTLPSS